jgi:hypothetical protein
MITKSIQRPADDNPKFVCFDLYEVPLALYAEILADGPASKPLYCEKKLSSHDVGSLSLVEPQGFLSPESKGCVFQLFNHLYGANLVLDCRPSQPLVDSSTVTFLIAHHPLLFEEFRHYRAIDCDYNFRAKEFLVVLRGLEESPAVIGLLEILSSSYLDHLREHPEVVIDKIMASN